MALNISLLLTSAALLLGVVHGLDDSSPPESHLPSSIFHNITDSYWKNIYDKIFHDFQSYFKLEKYQKNNTQPCKVKVEASGQPDTFKLQFQRNSINHTCNFSTPLHLDYNGLDNLSPDVFDKLKKFVSLLLGHNNLDSLNLTISQDSNFLETLNIDMNNLFNLSRQIFHDLKDLKTLTLNKNNFSVIPQDLFHHNKKLKTIELTQNKNLTKLPSRLFSDLIDLKVVLLRDNRLDRLEEDLFWGSYNLKEIDLSNNNLQYLPKNLLRDSHELRIFNASFNMLWWLLPNGMFKAANQLIKLDLSNNYIGAITAESFAGLNSLQILNMGNNQILNSGNESTFYSLTNLRVANFSGNRLFSLGTRHYDRNGRKISQFSRCHLLEELYLSGNRIIEMYSDWMFNLTKLRILDLSRNIFYDINAKDLQFNSTDLYVDLTHNNIHFLYLDGIGSIPKIANVSRNVTVNLNWNPLYCDCDIFSLVRYVMNETTDWLKPEDLNYVKLITDNLYCGVPYKLGKPINQLSDEVLTCGVYEEQDNLAGYYCPYFSCSCQIIPKYNLLKINCANQSWFSVPSSKDAWHIDYAYLDFSNTSLERITHFVKGRYDSVRELYLDISGNQIDHIEEDLLTENLRGLVLDGNNLTETDMEMIKLKAPNAVTKGIREKSWPCDPAIKEYQEYAINRFKLKEPIDWDIKKFMCPVKTRYFVDA